MTQLEQWLKIEKRMKNAWNYLMRTEPAGFNGYNPRWEKFKAVRDRLNPLRMPLRWRLEIGLCNMGKCKVYEGTINEIMASDKVQIS